MHPDAGERVLDALAIVSGLSALVTPVVAVALDLSIGRLVLLLVCVFAAFLASLALRADMPLRSVRQRALLFVVLFVSVVCFAICLLTEREEIEILGSAPGGGRIPEHVPQREPQGSALGQWSTAYESDGSLRSLAASDTAQWLLRARGVVRFDERGLTSPELPIPTKPYDIAASRSHLVVTTFAGTATMLDLEDLSSAPSSMKFGPVPGEVTIGYGSAWIGNPDTAKIERWSLGTSTTQSIDVARSPTDLLIAEGSVWVTMTGMVERIDPETGVVVEAPYEVPRGPTSMACLRGVLWVSHPGSRQILRFDTRTGRRVEPALDAPAGTTGLISFRSQIWGVSTTLDELVRFDRQGDGYTTMAVPPGPSELTKFNGQLYILSKISGQVIQADPIVVPPS